MTGKPWYRSKTIWANVVALIASVTTAMGLNLGLDAQTQGTIVAGIMAVTNVVLRLFTDTPVRGGPKDRGGGSGAARASASALVMPPLALSLVVALALAVSGCGAIKDAVVADNPPQTPAEVLGDYNARLDAFASAVTRASRSGTLTLEEVVELRGGIGKAAAVADEAQRLLAAGQAEQADGTLNRAEAVLGTLQRELKEAKTDE